MTEKTKATIVHQNGDLVIFIKRPGELEKVLDYGPTALLSENIVYLLDACGIQVKTIHDKTPKFTPESAQALIEKTFSVFPVHACEWPPEKTIVDQEEIETYINEPDDPADYFAKFDTEAELCDDFEEFLKGYARG
jgi:hypothetical protein